MVVQEVLPTHPAPKSVRSISSSMDNSGQGVGNIEVFGLLRRFRFFFLFFYSLEFSWFSVLKARFSQTKTALESCFSPSNSD